MVFLRTPPGQESILDLSSFIDTPSTNCTSSLFMFQAIAASAKSCMTTPPTPRPLPVLLGPIQSGKGLNRIKKLTLLLVKENAFCPATLH